MTLREALSAARQQLKSSGIDEPDLESEILLRHVLNISRAQLYLDLEQSLSVDRQTAYFSLISRRAAHEPTAYITKHIEFYGMDFYVDNRVLIPRSATETLIDETLKLAKQYKNQAITIAEAGPGSGIISITLAKHLPTAEIYACDISLKALEVTGLNSSQHGVASRIHLLRSDLLDSLTVPVDFIVANLPYIRTAEMLTLSPEIQLFEPILALDGGEDGLDIIRRLCRDTPRHLKPGGHVLLELGEGQATPLKSWISRLYPQTGIDIVKDGAHVDRVMVIHHIVG